MAIRDAFKVGFKTFFNPRAWMGYDYVKENTKTSLDVAKRVFTTNIAIGEAETFEEAVKRLKLTEEDIQSTEKSFFGIAVSFALIGVVLFLLGIVLIIDAYFAGFILAMCFSILIFAQAFKYHFWYYQIKKRKLGCTYQEWRHDLF